MTINERFAEILKAKNISVKDAVKITGMSEGYIRKLMRAGESFGIDPVLSILNSIEGINPDWLLRENGAMFINKEGVPVTNAPTTDKDIKILDIRVCAGQGVGLNGEENKVIGYVNIPEFTGCYGITVYGDSMYDMYMSGDIIFVREIKDKRNIDNGQPYVIITKEDRLLKMIHIDYEHRRTILSSYNNTTNPDGKRKYPDMEIDIDNDVIHLYKIVGKLARTQM